MWVVLWRVSSRDNICTKSRHIWKWLTLWLQLIKSIGNILGGFRGPVKGLPSSATSLSKRIDRNRIWLFRLPGLILILSLRIFPSLVIQCRLSSFPKFHIFCHFSNENDLLIVSANSFSMQHKNAYVWPKPTQSESSMQAGYFNVVVIVTIVDKVLGHWDIIKHKNNKIFVFILLLCWCMNKSSPIEKGKKFVWWKKKFKLKI